MPSSRPPARGSKLAESIYERLKAEIAAFRLLPGDRFSEGEVAERMRASRTPVREALFRLQREGQVQVLFRSGWQIPPFDFKVFEDLYDVRIVLELAAVERIVAATCDQAMLEELRRLWLVPEAERVADGMTVAGLDERFHEILVESTGNAELARLHHDVGERIRLVRRLDFGAPARVAATYHEHGAILRAVLRRDGPGAQRLLRTHIEDSKAEVHAITLSKLQLARASG